MLLGKGSKLLPIRDLLFWTGRGSRLDLDISGFRLALEPQVDSVATDVEHLTGFTFFHAIELNGLHHFLSKVVTVSLCHLRLPKPLLVLVYVLSKLAAAIVGSGSLSSSAGTPAAKPQCVCRQVIILTEACILLGANKPRIVIVCLF